ncbi:hypothetical protein MNBD_GAMMA06-2220 [hydrothermal vent metagenome]|uniref:Uncharacterized protein n=1 Tax=hydrothermal vent metagenome TaxID=652676 RepID=A0A3B0WF83_9ZZZZ
MALEDLKNSNKMNKEQYITTEIVRTAYKQIPGIIAISILSGPITAYIFYPYVENL